MLVLSRQIDLPICNMGCLGQHLTSGDLDLRSNIDLTPLRSPLEMQSSGPAARPGPKFRPGRAFCGAQTKSAGLMPGSGEAITMYYALAAGLRAVIERCWPGSMLGSTDFVRCRSGLGLGFWRTFCTSSHHVIWFDAP